MPRYSKTGNLRKICGCQSWQTCSHAWHLTYQRNGKRIRQSLDNLLGYHHEDFDAARAAAVAVMARLDMPMAIPRFEDGSTTVTIRVKVPKCVARDLASRARHRFRRRPSAIVREALLYGLKRRFGVETTL
jgi:hypothetical protein